MPTATKGEVPQERHMRHAHRHRARWRRRRLRVGQSRGSGHASRSTSPSSPGYVAAVDTARRGLRSLGCAVLEGFVRPEAVRVLNDEVLERKHATHYSTEIINPYFHTAVDPAYPDDHVVNTFLERTSGFIPGDAWDRGCATDTLFRAPEVARLLADCLEIAELHCYDDPAGRANRQHLRPRPAIHLALRHQRLRRHGAGAARHRRRRRLRVRAGHPLGRRRGIRGDSLGAGRRPQPRALLCSCGPVTCRSSVAATRCTG